MALLRSYRILVVGLLFHISAASIPTAVDNLKWVPFEKIEPSCNSDSSSIFTHVQDSGVCEKYHTGTYCRDGTKIIKDCISTTSQEYFCGNVSLGCQHPKMVLTDGGTAILPLMHATNMGPIEQCIRRKQSKKRIHFLFLGDSQTHNLRFDLRRWIDRGRHLPTEAMDQLDYNNWTVTMSSIFINAINPTTSRAYTNTTIFERTLVEHLNIISNYSGIENKVKIGSSKNGVPGRVDGIATSSDDVELVVVVGFGIWDLAFSWGNVLEDLKVESMRMMQNIARSLSLHAAAQQSMKVHVYIRNSFLSYKTAKQHMPHLGALNEMLEVAFLSVRNEYAFDTNLAFSFLDVFKLSMPRKSEMPVQNDGLHWCCPSSVKWPTSSCIYQLGKQRPDEVGWAATQLILLDYCDIFSLI